MQSRSQFQSDLSKKQKQKWESLGKKNHKFMKPKQESPYQTQNK